MRRRRSFVVVATMLLLALFTVPSATAVTVPIKMDYAGTFTFTGPTCPAGEIPVTDMVTGTSSHLGLMTATYPHCANLGTGRFSGTATFEAANGDELFVLLGGSADDLTCLVTGTPCSVAFTGTITAGTGRFEGAQGTLAGGGTVDLILQTVEVELTGTINKNPLQ